VDGVAATAPTGGPTPSAQPQPKVKSPPLLGPDGKPLTKAPAKTPPKSPPPAKDPLFF
jgi:hypothetical protein